MNYCDKCNVEIEKGAHHCPLCGRSVDDSPNNEAKTTRFPDYADFYKHRLHVTTLLARIIFVLTLFCIFINIVLTPNFFWSAFVIACAFLVMIGVLMPIRLRMSMSTLTKFQIFGVSAVIIVIEVFSKTFGWGVGFVIPLILLGYAIVNSVLLIVKGYVDFDYFLPLVFILFCSILIFILNKFVFNLAVWPTLLAILMACLTIGLLLLLRFKRTIKCFKKHWRL